MVIVHHCRCSTGTLIGWYPLYVASVASRPSTCLVASCGESRCPKCVVDPKKRGEPVVSALRDPEETIRLMKREASGAKSKKFEAQGLRQGDPFWKDLPHCDIFHCFTPDLLHQLHKGVFKDHIVDWSTESLGGTKAANEEEIDFRFRLMPSHPSLRHFKLGISLVSQWTGNEFKHMEKIFLGVLNGCADPPVVRAVRGILDFIYYSHFDTHTDDSLAKLGEAWMLFHNNKGVFIVKGVREHFNIPKIHSMQHYVDMIRSLGTTDGYNTELSERLHIDYAKLGYKAFASYLQWAIPGYVAALNGDDEQESEDDEADESDSEDIAVGTSATSSSAAAAPTYSIAKKAPFPVSVDSLEREFGAANFLSHLETFLSDKKILPRRFHDISAPFSVYKRVVIKIPAVVQVSSTITNDPIRAVRESPSSGLKRAKPGHFDTVLARKSQPASPPKRLSLDGKIFFLAMMV
ncbi:hypothetical protein R3P38DRAFT_3336914 [Favolaschia claudopus]|uniref:Uncharacterized protein n=1 Tax=Favolaschia claudopus TaxID=2862362 RepID=A0AAV9Z3J7_9AGAR